MAEDQATTANLTAHLRELRKRIIISIAALAAGFIVAYVFSDKLYHLLTHPLIPAMPKGFDFIAFTGVVEPFFVYIKVGFLGAAVLASPVILYEAWAFVAPGLYGNERRWFIALVIASFVLFASGVLFAFFVVFPFAFKYLLSYASEDLRPILSMNAYFSLVTRLLLAFGIVYQLPLAILVLARMGIVTSRQLVSWWRYAVLAIVVAAAVLTPTPDIFNQLLMAGPLLVLYALGIVVAKVFGKERKKPKEEEGDKEGAGETEDTDEEGLEKSEAGDEEESEGEDEE